MKKLSAYEAAQAFYNFFFKKTDFLSLRDYLDTSFCDEIGEIDFNRDQCQAIYHVTNKYFVYFGDGSYSSIFRFCKERIIHPDDRAIYDDLMNPENMLEKLKNSPTPNFRFAHIRYLLQDGTYRWVEQAIIAGHENELKPGIVRFYVFDIENNKRREEGYDKRQSSSYYAYERNKITGLLLEKDFYNVSTNLIQKYPSRPWSIVCVDIEHFRLLDEWYGRQKGDDLLAHIGTILSKELKGNKGVAAYFGQDDFAVLIPYEEKRIKKIYDEIHAAIDELVLSSGFLPAFGICKLEGGLSPKDGIDRASIALFKAKSNLENRIVVYDQKTRAKEEEDYRVMLEFMDALNNDEITFYLQPQVRISNKKLVGAEALCRWIKKSGEVVPPMRFIPVLERYGFITELDKRVWEKVAQFIKAKLNQGIDMVPISVNVSRLDIFSMDIALHFRALVKKYGIPAHTIKIEITESAYAEDSDGVIPKLIEHLRKSGFMVLMDDFGSGYSSLNTLSSLHVDAIKLDAAFLDIKKDFNKGIHILESVINMAKVISLPIIMEGVEEKEQIDFLNSVGLRYVQGFYYYKPLPISEFEKLIEQKNILDHSGITAKGNAQFTMREFLDNNVYSDAMLNNIIGPAAYYVLEGTRVDIVRYNQQFYEAVNVQNFTGRLEHIERFMPEEERPLLVETMRKAMDNKLVGQEGLFHFYKTDGKLTSFYITFYFLGAQDGLPRFYGAARNVTPLAEKEAKLNLLGQYSNDSVVFVSLENGQPRFEVFTHGLEKYLGMSKENLQKELDDKTFWARTKEGASEELKNALLNALKKKRDYGGVFEVNNPKGKVVKLRYFGQYVKEKASNIQYIVYFNEAKNQK